jgi:glycosyltransferase involved in cell wall biosynthesis
LPISVVVCCSNDPDVVKLLDSIDHPQAEIVGALTPNAMIQDYFEQRGFRYALTSVGNHAATTNAGIALASHDKIVVVDSDCVLDPGAVKAVEDLLDEAPVVNLPIRFAAGRSPLSRAIAACRHFDNTYSKAALKPGIAFRAEVRSALGGYWFDERIRWPCDSEFLWRLTAAQVPIRHVGTHWIEHRPIPLRHALRAYTAYGRDGWKRLIHLRQTTHLYPLTNLGRKWKALLAASVKEPGVLLNVVFELAYIAGFVREAVGHGWRRPAGGGTA